MCTVTIKRKQNDVLLTMNRDERKDRGDEVEPIIYNNNVAYPLDIKSQGSWVGANKHGVVACLLNLYEFDTTITTKSIKSRGEIIPKILQEESLEKVEIYFNNNLDLKNYMPFQLLVLDKKKTIFYVYNGNNLKRNEYSKLEWKVFSSSSWREKEVVAWRKRVFLKWLKDGEKFIEKIPSFHVSTIEKKESWTPMMSRIYSHTKSITQIHLSQEKAQILYWSLPFDFTNYKMVNI